MFSNLNSNYPPFVPENYFKPDPNYSYIHDKFIIPAKDPLHKQDYSRKSFETKVISNKSDSKKLTGKKPDFAKTELGFKMSNAQKLDRFLGK